MGLGDMIGSVFGGGNDFQAAAPPTVGKPGQTPEQAYADYQKQMGQYGHDIHSAMNRTRIPGNVLDMSQSNQVAGQQQTLANALQGKMGQNMNFSGANASLGQQNGLIGQLLAQGQGYGPNPALDQLHMTTDANTRAQAGMLGSQRGINPALASRMAAQNMAGANQQASGQAALMSAQQQLGAQQAAGGLLGQQIGQQVNMAGMNAAQQQQYAQMLAQQQQAMRSGAMNQSTAQGQAGLGLLSANINQEMGERGAQNAYQNMLNTAYNNTNAINAGVAAQNASQNFQWGQAGMQGISSAIGGVMGMAQGGEVPMKVTVEESDIRDKKKNYKTRQEFARLRGSPMTSDEEKMYMDYVDAKGYAGGGMTGNPGYDGGISDFTRWQGDPMQGFYSAISNVPQGKAGIEAAGKIGGNFGKFLNGIFPSGPAIGGMADMGGAAELGGEAGEAGGLAELAPLALASQGGTIPGKAQVKGDSKTNDTVPAMLSPGEIVIPRTDAQSPEAAHAFLDQILSKKIKGYGDVLKAKREADMWYGGCVK